MPTTIIADARLGRVLKDESKTNRRLDGERCHFKSAIKLQSQHRVVVAQMEPVLETQSRASCRPFRRSLASHARLFVFFLSLRSKLKSLSA